MSNEYEDEEEWEDENFEDDFETEAEVSGGEAAPRDDNKDTATAQAAASFASTPDSPSTTPSLNDVAVQEKSVAPAETPVIADNGESKSYILAVKSSEITLQQLHGAPLGLPPSSPVNREEDSLTDKELELLSSVVAASTIRKATAQAGQRVKTPLLKQSAEGFSATHTAFSHAKSPNLRKQTEDSSNEMQAEILTIETQTMQPSESQNTSLASPTVDLGEESMTEKELALFASIVATSTIRKVVSSRSLTLLGVGVGETGGSKPPLSSPSSSSRLFIIQRFISDVLSRCVQKILFKQKAERTKTAATAQPASNAKQKTGHRPKTSEGKKEPAEAKSKQLRPKTSAAPSSRTTKERNRGTGLPKKTPGSSLVSPTTPKAMKDEVQLSSAESAGKKNRAPSSGRPKAKERNGEMNQDKQFPVEGKEGIDIELKKPHTAGKNDVGGGKDAAIGADQGKQLIGVTDGAVGSQGAAVPETKAAEHIQKEPIIDRKSNKAKGNETSKPRLAQSKMPQGKRSYTAKKPPATNQTKTLEQAASETNGKSVAEDKQYLAPQTEAIRDSLETVPTDGDHYAEYKSLNATSPKNSTSKEVNSAKAATPNTTRRNVLKLFKQSEEVRKELKKSNGQGLASSSPKASHHSVEKPLKQGEGPMAKSALSPKAKERKRMVSLVDERQEDSEDDSNPEFEEPATVEELDEEIKVIKEAIEVSRKKRLNVVRPRPSPKATKKKGTQKHVKLPDIYGHRKQNSQQPGGPLDLEVCKRAMEWRLNRGSIMKETSLPEWRNGEESNNMEKDGEVKFIGCHPVSSSVKEWQLHDFS